MLWVHYLIEGLIYTCFNVALGGMRPPFASNCSERAPDVMHLGSLAHLKTPHIRGDDPNGNSSSKSQPESSSKTVRLCPLIRIMASPPPAGIYVPVPTFFTKTSSSAVPPLDLASQVTHAQHLAKCGIRGLVLLGSTGEAIAVTNEERKKLISHVRKEMETAGYKDYPLIAGTATQGIEETISQLHISKEAGAQWGLVLAPGFFATCVLQLGLIDWYTAIADQSPLPILMYAATALPTLRLSQICWYQLTHRLLKISLPRCFQFD